MELRRAGLFVILMMVSVSLCFHLAAALEQQRVQSRRFPSNSAVAAAHSTYAHGSVNKNSAGSDIKEREIMPVTRLHGGGSSGSSGGGGGVGGSGHGLSGAKGQQAGAMNNHRTGSHKNHAINNGLDHTILLLPYITSIALIYLFEV